MLTHEMLGAFALFVFWGNTLLVVLASWRKHRELGARLRIMGDVRCGSIASTGKTGWLACHHVEQIGRRAADDADRKAILFHDRRYWSEIDGGTIETASGPIAVGNIAEREAEVWVEHAAQEKAALCPSPEQFEEAYRASSKARGYVRTVSTSLRVGDAVWVAGERTSTDGEHVVGPSRTGPLLIASFNPRRWCQRQRLVLLAFMLVTLAIAAGITTLTLYPPLFGSVSTVGGAIALLFFLLVQPAGVMARERTCLPSSAILRGSWVARGSEGQGAPAPGTELPSA